MSEPTPPTASDLATALHQSGRRGLFGVPSDRLIRWFFQSNAAVAIIVLGLITFTLFREAIGFIPQNQDNLTSYRRSGQEYVDIVRRQVEDFSAVSRYLQDIRRRELEPLLAKGLSNRDAQREIRPFDRYADELADSISEHRALVSEWGEVATAVKERYKLALDLAVVKRDTERAAERATGEDAVRLRKQAEEIVVETVDFRAEVKPMLDELPRFEEANRVYAARLRELAAAEIPTTPVTAAQVEKFRSYVKRLADEAPEVTKELRAWKQDEPVSWAESATAFFFDTRWITASFWQDWYGVLPLVTGSLLISMIALVLAIPFGVAAAVYVNQLARPIEAKVVKPLLEFIAAIPSVVLGFFGIAVLGATLRDWSQVSWLAWVPGFPMNERLTAITAGCLLALMAIPTIFSLAEDAINNVPRTFKEAALGLGATRLQTILRIILPTALSGILAAVLLGLGRVIGETMVVLLCAGNRIQVPDLTAGLGVVFQPVHTMTGIIAQEMGEVPGGSLHYRALFMVGCLLFMISLAVNFTAQRIVQRYKLTLS